MEPNVEEPKKEEEEDEEEDIICDICEVQMQSASSLITHKKQKHDPKICPDCGVVVKGEKALKKSQKKTCHNSMSIMLYSVMLIITMKYYLKCNLFTFI